MKPIAKKELMIQFMELLQSKPAIWDVFSEDYKNRDIKR